MNKPLVSILAVLMIAFVSVTSISAFGSVKGFGFNSDLTDEEKIQQQQSMQTAIEDNDYSTWKSLIEEAIAKMQAQITEDNFNELVEQNSQIKSMQEEQKSLQTAIKNNDYDSWASLMTAQITEDNFNELVEKHQKINESMKELKPFFENSSKDLSKAPELSETEIALREAIANNNYDSWKTVMESQITEDNFNTLVENYSQMKEQKSSDRNFESLDSISDKKRQSPLEKQENRHSGLGFF